MHRKQQRVIMTSGLDIACLGASVCGLAGTKRVFDKSAPDTVGRLFKRSLDVV